MTLVVSPTLAQIYVPLRAWLLTVLPNNVQVVQGINNRVPSPPIDPGYVVMQAVLQNRLRTNIDRWDESDLLADEIAIEQGTQLTVQLDCYGALSSDWAVMLSTLLRDEAACTALAPLMAPLYANDPILAPWVDGEEQYEERWIVGAVLQYNPVTSTAQEFANAAEVALINVDEAYPP